MSGVRAAVRSLRSTPLPSVAAIATLGLAIGAATAVFTVAHAVLLKPLPYPEPERLVVVTSEFPSIHLRGLGLSPPEFLELRELTTAWAALGAVRFETGALGAATPQRVGVAAASADLLRGLAVQPLAGRLFDDSHDRPGAEAVALLGHALWTTTFGADPGILGRAIDLDGRPRIVLGVMPEGFDLLGTDTGVWIPLALDPATPGGRADHNLRVVGRVRPALTIDLARVDLDAAVTRWMVATGEIHSPAPRFHPLSITPLHDVMVGDVRRTIWLLTAAVALLLALACANVANLLVARAEAARHQLAIRVALGAPWRRLLADRLTEGLLLSTAGAAGGTVLAWVVVAALASSSVPVPRQREVALDRVVLQFAVGLTGACGVFVGLVPVLRLDLRRAAAWLRPDGWTTTVPRERRRLQRALVACQVALAVTLLAAAGVVGRSFWRLARVDPGIATRDVLTVQVSLPDEQYRADELVWSFYERLIARLQALPGVRAAGAMSGRLPERRANNTTFVLEGVPVRGHDGMPQVEFIQHVTPGALAALEVRLLRGRMLESSEAAPVALVNETLARKFFPGADPLGRRLRAAVPDTPWFTIVGVVSDMKQAGLRAPPGAEIYIPHRQARLLLPGWLPSSMEVVIGATPEAVSALRGMVRPIVREIDPAAPVARVSSMDESVKLSLESSKFLAGALVGFALAALLLATIGVYAVVAFGVAQRTTEFGVRLALGARPRAVLALVLRQAMMPVAVGIVLGLGGALLSQSLIVHLLYETSATDRPTLTAVVILLAAVAVVATWLPARRATKLDPLDALRRT